MVEDLEEDYKETMNRNDCFAVFSVKRLTN